MSERLPQQKDLLLQGVHALGLDLSAAQTESLWRYLGLLMQWNRVYNLTAVRDPNDMVTHHLLDSLSAAQALHRQVQVSALSGLGRTSQPLSLLDVGSGGGLPGVVLATVFPQFTVDCVDAVGKKAAFVGQVAASLGLKNLRGLHARVEQLGTGRYDVVCSRAFASLRDFVSWSDAALQPMGVWMAMKGKHPTDELAQLTQLLAPSVRVFHVEPLQVPGLNAQRCVVWMRKKDRPEPEEGGEAQPATKLT